MPGGGRDDFLGELKLAEEVDCLAGTLVCVGGCASGFVLPAVGGEVRAFVVLEGGAGRVCGGVGGALGGDEAARRGSGVLRSERHPRYGGAGGYGSAEFAVAEHRSPAD